MQNIDIPKLIRFGVTGGSTAAVQLGLIWVLTDGLRLPIVIGSTIALIVAGLYNYTLHYYWTFSVDLPHGATMVRYALMCLGALLLNGLIMHVGVTLWDFHYFIVQVVAGFSVVAWSFGCSALWVFVDKS